LTRAEKRSAEWGRVEKIGEEVKRIEKRADKNSKHHCNSYKQNFSVNRSTSSYGKLPPPALCWFY